MEDQENLNPNMQPLFESAESKHESLIGATTESLLSGFQFEDDKLYSIDMKELESLVEARLCEMLSDVLTIGISLKD